MDKFKIRRAILQACNECAPAVAKAEEIAMSIPMLAVSKKDKVQMITQQCVKMELKKFVVNRRGGNSALEPLWAITAEGMEQIDQTAEKLSPFIWDSLAF